MNYDIERALAGKVDNWQLHALQSEIQTLQGENQRLRSDIADLDASARKHYSTISDLIQFLIDTSECGNESILYGLRNQL